MNKGASVVFILILLLFYSPFTTSAGSYSNVTVSEANNLIDSNPSLVVLDVRTRSEYDSGHIRNAKLIPVSELGGRLNELDKTSEILVYGKSGVTSATANQILVNSGFLHIYNMLEGVTAWISAGYPVYVKYSSIQEAINNASEGATIFVSSGIYYEHLVLNKTVSLVGEDSETTVVYGDGTQTVLRLINRNVNVTRFKIQNGTNGVYISNNADFCIINGCNVMDNRIGVFVEESDSNVLKGNIIFNNSEQGIKIFASCDCEPVWENIVTDNELVGNSIGILLMNSQSGMIYHNCFINNLFQAYGSETHTAWNKPDKWDNGYPSGGNYWSDYTGVDLDSGLYQNLTGSDGIGDTLYAVDAENRDMYPLMAPFGRDVAVMNIAPYKNVVGVNYTITINATVQNQGFVEAGFKEAFNVSIYVNETLIRTEIISLVARASSTLTLAWNTSGFAKGNYIIRAYAWPVPGETDTADNTLIEGTVYVGIPGDVNADSVVDVFDLVTVANSYGSGPQDPKWNPNADVNGDGIVDIFDLVIVANHYGEET